jgi:galactokinase
MNLDLKLVTEKLYGNKTDGQYQRYVCLIDKFKQRYGGKEYKLFSSPGRTEIGGNHTDHNHGKVIAASINLDSIAVAAANDLNRVAIWSEGFEKSFLVSLDNLEPVKDEEGTTTSLIRGVAAGFKNKGFSIGGFDACITSDVLIGSGLSSSASIEVLIGTIFNYFYNNSSVSGEQVAVIGQYAENKFFGKPCGLMDQVACATGGIITIDFFDPAKPKIEKINFDFRKTGCSLVVVDTEENHADLTDDYASIPAEMKSVAAFFNKKFLSEVNEDDFIVELKVLRKSVSDRSILRAIHFFEENKRVEQEVDALKRNSFEEFLSLVNESGNSSYKYLQNIYSPKNFNEQGISLGLALSDIFIKEKGKGACRIHGGGFAGTIQLFLPENMVEDYCRAITKLYRKESVKILSIRNYGAVCLSNI